MRGHAGFKSRLASPAVRVTYAAIDVLTRDPITQPEPNYGTVVFFEGFNRTLNQNLWTLNSDGNGNNMPAINGNSGRTAGSLFFSNSAMTSTTSQPGAKLTFAAQTDNNVYVGFAAMNWLGGDTPGTSTTNEQKYLTVYSSTNDEVFSVFVDNAGVEDVNLMGLTIKQGSTFVARYLITPATNVDGSGFAGQHDSQPAALGFDQWNYLEFEIDVDNSEVAVRRNGTHLLTETTSSQTAALTNPVTDVAGLKFFGGYVRYSYVDDLYITTDSGAAINEWFGPTARIYTPEFSYSKSYQEQWATNGYTYSNIYSFGYEGSNFYGYLGTEDGDSTYLSCSALDRVSAGRIVVDPAAGVNAVIGGIIFTTSSRCTSATAAYKHVYLPNYSSSGLDLSSRIIVSNTTYAKVYSLSTTNPATSLPWTVNTIEGGGFGIKSVDPA